MSAARGGSTTPTPSTRHIGILVYDEMEVLDVAGPFEVFSASDRD